MGSTAKKNLRVFREICGDKSLDHVRIVTTNWNLVDEKQGNSRQDALFKGAFGPLIKEGAGLCRHDKGLESAQLIMSQLIHQPPVMMKIQEELNEGCTLADTSAGAMIIENMKELEEMHDKEMEVLRKEMEEALMVNDEELRLELDEERRKLEEMMARVEEDRKTLEKTRKARRTQLEPTVPVGAARMSNTDQMRAYEAATIESDVVRAPEEPQERERENDRDDSDEVMAKLGLTLMAGTAIALAGPAVAVAAGTFIAASAVRGIIKETRNLRDRGHGGGT